MAIPTEVVWRLMVTREPRLNYPGSLFYSSLLLVHGKDRMITMSKKRSTLIWLGTLLTMIVTCLLSACSNANVPSQTSGIAAGTTPITIGATVTSGTANTGSVSFIGIRMLDKTNGWALTTSSILKTSDGGIHWKNVTPANTVLSQMAKGDFLSDKYAWIVNVSQDNTISV